MCVLIAVCDNYHANSHGEGRDDRARMTRLRNDTHLIGRKLAGRQPRLPATPWIVGSLGATCCAAVRGIKVAN